MRTEPGSGFINRGGGDLVPSFEILADVNAANLDPSLVLIQGGHNGQGRNQSVVHTHSGRLAYEVCSSPFQ